MARNNYTSMTAHGIRQPRNRAARAALTSTMPARTQPVTPNVGLRIKIDPSLIVQEEENGVPKTPMTKIRYCADAQEWRQVPRTEAGMMVFCNNKPDHGHTSCEITSVIPTGTACYADLW